MHGRAPATAAGRASDGEATRGGGRDDADGADRAADTVDADSSSDTELDGVVVVRYRRASGCSGSGSVRPEVAVVPAVAPPRACRFRPATAGHGDTLCVRDWIGTALVEEGMLASVAELDAALEQCDSAGAVGARHSHGRTLLHLAAAVGHVDLLQWLLAQPGADVDVRTADEAGATPLHVAAEHGVGHPVRVLVAHGADVHARDRDGRTPLHVAALDETRLEAAISLVESGASLFATDNAGRRPVDIEPLLAETQAHLVSAAVAAGDAVAMQRFAGNSECRDAMIGATARFKDAIAAQHAASPAAAASFVRTVCALLGDASVEARRKCADEALLYLLLRIVERSSTAVEPQQSPLADEACSLLSRILCGVPLDSGPGEFHRGVALCSAPMEQLASLGPELLLRLCEQRDGAMRRFALHMLSISSAFAAMRDQLISADAVRRVLALAMSHSHGHCDAVAEDAECLAATLYIVVNVSMRVRVHSLLLPELGEPLLRSLLAHPDEAVRHHAATIMVHIGLPDTGTVHLFADGCVETATATTGTATGQDGRASSVGAPADADDIIVISAPGERDDGQVRGASLWKTVELLTATAPAPFVSAAPAIPPIAPPPEAHTFVDMILTTFRSFCHPLILLRLLRHRLYDPLFCRLLAAANVADGPVSVAAPVAVASATPQPMASAIVSDPVPQAPVASMARERDHAAPLRASHQRVLAVLQKWLGIAPNDFHNDPAVKDEMLCIVNDLGRMRHAAYREWSVRLNRWLCMPSAASRKSSMGTLRPLGHARNPSTGSICNHDRLYKQVCTRAHRGADGRRDRGVTLRAR